MRLVDLVILILLVAGAFAFGRCGAPVQTGDVQLADTVYVDREVPKIQTVEKPVRIIEYRTVSKVDTVRITVPATDFTPFGVVEQDPISYKRNNIVLTAFSPSEGQYYQQTFKAPTKRFTAGIQGYAGLQYVGTPDNRFYSFGIMATGRYKRIGLLVMPAYGAEGLSVTVGLTYSLYGR